MKTDECALGWVTQRPCLHQVMVISVLNLSSHQLGQVVCTSEMKQSLQDKEEGGDLRLHHRNTLQPL